MIWTEDTLLEPLGGCRYRGHVSDEWTSLQGVHGGVVAALAVTAAETELRADGVDVAATLRSATFGYVSGNVVGDLTLEVEVVRRGRSLVTTHVQASQNGKTTTVARMHHSPPWEGMAYSDLPDAPVRPDGTVPFTFADSKSHINNVETHLNPATGLFAGTERAEWLAWSRPLEGGAFDAPWLVMFGDYFPPAVFTKATTPQRAVTIEYSIQIHDAAEAWVLSADEYLAARMHASHSHDGFAVEDGWIYLPGGQPLATTRQTRLAG